MLPSHPQRPTSFDQTLQFAGPVRADDRWVAMSFFFFQAEDGIRDVAVTGVQTCASSDLGEAFPKQHDERLQPLLQHIMIVVAPGVTRNPAPRVMLLASGFSVQGKWVIGVVVEQANDNALYSRHSPARIFTARVEKIVHFSGVTAFEPVLGVFELREFFRADHAAQVESDPLRLLCNPNGVRRLIHPRDCAAAESWRRAFGRGTSASPGIKRFFAGSG